MSEEHDSRMRPSTENTSIKAAPTQNEEIEYRASLQHTLTNGIHGFQIDYAALPKGYYRSPFFLGTFLATSLAILSGTATFGLAAPILGAINADIGPDDRYVWISLIYNAALAILLSPVGRLSDIFGRRHFFVGGAVVTVGGASFVLLRKISQHWYVFHLCLALSSTDPIRIGGNVLPAAAT